MGSKSRDSGGWISIRDPIHGYIVLPKEFTLIIDDPIFQRLRDVKQLGLTHYVFPGAVHNRFSHMLGTAYTAMRILDSLRVNTERYVLQYLNDKEKSECIIRVLRELSERDNYYAIVLAALMHDLGHLAFSHLTEEAILDLALLVETGDVNSSPGGFETLGERIAKKMKMHENITITIVDEYIKSLASDKGDLKAIVDVASEILNYSYNNIKYKKCDDSVNSICGSAGCVDECVKELVKCIGVNIINNPLDADRLDFLLRDSYYAGIISPRPDIHRLLETFVIAPLPDSVAPFRGKPTLAVVDKGLDTVEHTLLSRVYLYKDVYLHTVSLAYEGIAKRLIAILLLLASAPTSPEEKVIRCLKTVMIDTPSKHGEAYKECLLNLTDTGLMTLIATLALDKDASVYSLLLDTENGPYRSAEDAKKNCLTLALAARAIHGRRHWPFIPVERPVVRSLSNTTAYYPLNPDGKPPKPGGERKDYSVLDRLVRRAIATTVIQPAVWAAYDSRRSGPSKRIWIFSRKLRETLLLSRDEQAPEISTHKVILDEIDGKRFMKLLIMNPLLNPDLASRCPTAAGIARGLADKARMKRGKLQLEDYEHALKACKLGWRELSSLLEEDMRALGEAIRLVLRHRA